MQGIGHLEHSKNATYRYTGEITFDLVCGGLVRQRW